VKIRNLGILTKKEAKLSLGETKEAKADKEGDV